MWRSKTADYGYVLEVGRMVMEDSCERLLIQEDIKEFYLGMKAAGVRGTNGAGKRRRRGVRWEPHGSARPAARSQRGAAGETRSDAHGWPRPC